MFSKENKTVNKIQEIEGGNLKVTIHLLSATPPGKLKGNSSILLVFEVL